MTNQSLELKPEQQYYKHQRWSNEHINELARLRSLGYDSYTITKHLRKLGRVECTSAQVNQLLNFLKLRSEKLKDIRVRRVRELIGEGLDDKMIAEKLLITKNHVRQIRCKHKIPPASSSRKRAMDTTIEKFGMTMGEYNQHVKEKKRLEAGWLPWMTDSLIRICLLIDDRSLTISEIADESKLTRTRIWQIVRYGESLSCLFRHGTSQRRVKYSVSNTVRCSEAWKKAKGIKENM